MTVEIDCDPENEQGPLSAIVGATISYDFCPGERRTYDYPGSQATIEDFALVSIESASVLLDGHPTTLKVGEWSEATKAAWHRYVNRAMETCQDYLNDQAWEDLAGFEDWDGYED